MKENAFIKIMENEMIENENNEWINEWMNDR